MRNMVISGILVTLITLGISFIYVGDMIGDDMINIITMVASVIILTASTGITLKYINQMKNDKASGELKDDVWDDTIQEYNNKLPIGWALSFVASIIFAIYYFLVAYPVGEFSQIGQWNEEVLAHNEKFKHKWKDITIEEKQEMGKNLYLVQCSTCHGVTSEGLNGKSQDLTSRMSKEQILDVIKNGQNQLAYPMGAMPAGMASGKAADDVATWITGGMKGTQPTSYASCAGCHGVDGKGNNGMSPNLVEYDSTLVKSVLNHGKSGIIGKMPNFKTIIKSDIQKEALTAYINSL